MAKVTSVMQFAAPVWVVFKRLEWHSRQGGTLQGLKFTREGTVRVASPSTMPSLQPYFAEQTSALSPGAPGAAKGGAQRANVPQADTFTLRLLLSTDAKHGFVRRDPASATERKGHLEWAALVQDAIERREDGTVDARLERTLGKPVDFALREPDETAAAVTSVLEVTLVSRPRLRGERGYDFPPLPVEQQPGG